APKTSLAYKADFYEIQKQLLNIKTAKSFGLLYNLFKKSESKKISALPDPGQYQIIQEIGSNKPKIKILG
ncbi:MAG: hypothetical protein ACK56I_12515, partial [bacterium]